MRRRFHSSENHKDGLTNHPRLCSKSTYNNERSARPLAPSCLKRSTPRRSSRLLRKLRSRSPTPASASRLTSSTRHLQGTRVLSLTRALLPHSLKVALILIYVKTKGRGAGGTIGASLSEQISYPRWLTAGRSCAPRTT